MSEETLSPRESSLQEEEKEYYFNLYMAGALCDVVPDDDVRGRILSSLQPMINAFEEAMDNGAFEEFDAFKEEELWV